MTKIIPRVLCQELCSVWAPGGAPRRHKGGACYWAGLVICDRAAWVTMPPGKLFKPASIGLKGAASTTFLSPTTQPGHAQISHRHCTHTAGCCAWATAQRQILRLLCLWTSGLILISRVQEKPACFCLLQGIRGAWQEKASAQETRWEKLCLETCKRGATDRHSTVRVLPQQKEKFKTLPVLFAYRNLP